MTKVAIVLASTRTRRASANVARWVLDGARQRGTAEVSLLSLNQGAGLRAGPRPGPAS